MSSSALSLSQSMGAIASSSTASTSVGSQVVFPAVSVRLEAGNFALWKGLLLPNLAGAALHHHLDETFAAPEKTITQGEGDEAITVANLEYARWWSADQKVIGYLLGSMEPDIANQLLGCKTAAAVWNGIHNMNDAQSRANVRHIRRQLSSTRKEDLSAAAYMHKMKSFADAMAAAGSPVTNDELVDYIVIGLGSAYNSITATLTFGDKSIPYDEFYSAILSYESLQAQQAQAEGGWSSSANATQRGYGAPYGAPYGNPGRQRAPEYPPPHQGGGNRPPGNGGQQGQGRPNGGNYGGNGGGGRQDGRNGGNGSNGRNGGNGRNNGGGNGKKWRPRCQICGYWGHEAYECRSRFDQDYRADNSRVGNAATMTSNSIPPWFMDSGATDHLTSDLERPRALRRQGSGPGGQWCRFAYFAYWSFDFNLFISQIEQCPSCS